MSGDTDFIWVADGEVMSGKLSNYCRAIEQCHYLGLELSDLYMVDVEDDRPVIVEANFRQTTFHSSRELYTAEVTAIDSCGFTQTAMFRLDLRA